MFGFHRVYYKGTKKSKVEGDEESFHVPSQIQKQLEGVNAMK